MNEFLFGIKGLTVHGVIFMFGLIVPFFITMTGLLLGKFGLMGREKRDELFTFAYAVFWFCLIVSWIIECSR